jgi:hypothetical protein
MAQAVIAEIGTAPRITRFESMHAVRTLNKMPTATTAAIKITARRNIAHSSFIFRIFTFIQISPHWDRSNPFPASRQREYCKAEFIVE